MADSKELDKIDEKSKLTTDGDTAKIKFQHSTNGESKIEMPDAGAVGFQCGLTKEELMKYANDPFWIVLRRVLLVLFWLLWIAMLVGAVAIIIVTPGCAAPKEPEWYENSPVYELRVDKFYTESGELPLVGVQKKLPYLEGISVSTVVLDKVFNSENPRTLNPDVGAFDVFSNLTQKVKVIVKIPLSKTNLTNVAGQRQFVATLDLYLRNGAAGFVFDEIELVSNSVNITKLIPLWQELIGNYSTEDFPRVAMLSSYGNELKEDEICDNRTFILNYGLTKLQRDFTAEQFLQQLEPTVDKNRTLCRENLVFSNGDILPLINRVKPTERDRIIMFSLLADATPFVYFGEEYAHDNNRTGLTSTLQRQKNIEPEKVNWEIVDTFSKVKTNTFYEVFKRTSAIRKKNNVIQTGQTHLKLLNSTVVAMSRIKKGMPGYVVVTNFNTTAPMTVNLQELGSHMPDHGETELVSSGFDMRGKQNFRELKIGSEETMILNFVANFPKD